MKKFLIILGLFLMCGAAVALAMSEGADKTYSWRYKVTVTIETPEGLKTGSAVREVNVKLTPYPRDTRNPYRTKVTVKGEAVVIDLAKSGILFSLLGTDDYTLVFNAFPLPDHPPGAGGRTPEGLEYYSQLRNIKKILEPAEYPKVVRFRDIKDPKTVELVYGVEAINVQNQSNFEYKITDNFEKIFGKGVKIKETTIEMTDEPVTHNIDKHLPSFEDITGFQEWANNLSYDDPLRIGLYNFK